MILHVRPPERLPPAPDTPAARLEEPKSKACTRPRVRRLLGVYFFVAGENRASTVMISAQSTAMLLVINTLNGAPPSSRRRCASRFAVLDRRPQASDPTRLPMHFFYLDETGDTGPDLENTEQPIFVLGGVTVSDNGMAEDDGCRSECRQRFLQWGGAEWL
jgi:hypothetical protein